MKESSFWVLRQNMVKRFFIIDGGKRFKMEDIKNADGNINNNESITSVSIENEKNEIKSDNTPHSIKILRKSIIVEGRRYHLNYSADYTG